jgi:hypothetical protein
MTLRGAANGGGMGRHAGDKRKREGDPSSSLPAAANGSSRGQANGAASGEGGARPSKRVETAAAVDTARRAGAAGAPVAATAAAERRSPPTQAAPGSMPAATGQVERQPTQAGGAAPGAADSAGGGSEQDMPGWGQWVGDAEAQQEHSVPSRPASSGKIKASLGDASCSSGEEAAGSGAGVPPLADGQAPAGPSGGAGASPAAGDASPPVAGDSKAAVGAAGAAAGAPASAPVSPADEPHQTRFPPEFFAATLRQMAASGYPLYGLSGTGAEGGAAAAAAAAAGQGAGPAGQGVEGQGALPEGWASTSSPPKDGEMQTRAWRVLVQCPGLVGGVGARLDRLSTRAGGGHAWAVQRAPSCPTMKEAGITLLSSAGAAPVRYCVSQDTLLHTSS